MGEDIERDTGVAYMSEGFTRRVIMALDRANSVPKAVMY